MNIDPQSLNAAIDLAMNDKALSKEDALRQIATTFNVQLQKRDSFRPANVNAPHPGEPTDYPLNKQAVYQLALANYDSAQRQRIADESGVQPYTDQQLLDITRMTHTQANNVRRPPVLQDHRAKQFTSRLGERLQANDTLVLPLLLTKSYNTQARTKYLRHGVTKNLRRALNKHGLDLTTHTNPHDALIGTVVQPE